jgi:hypothetical protein
MGTQARAANGDPGKRWDTSRISAFSEILAFYGLDYWYAYQVVHKPVIDTGRFERVWQQVVALSDAYLMNP